MHSFSYRFTGKELLYFIFGKKVCPQCGSALCQQKLFKIVNGSELNSRSDPFFMPNEKVKSYDYSYVCNHCGKRYSLSELACHKK